VGEEPGGLVGTPRASMSSLCCSPPSASVEVRGFRAMAPGAVATATATGGAGAYASRYTYAIRG
jgi:hypothetical protein